MDINGEGIKGDPDAVGLVAEMGFKAVDFTAFHLPAHGAELGKALNQSRGGGGGAFPLDLDRDIRVDCLEGFRPERHEVVEAVGTDGIKDPGNAGDGFVLGKVRIKKGGSKEPGRAEACGKEDNSGEGRHGSRAR